MGLLCGCKEDAWDVFLFVCLKIQNHHQHTHPASTHIPQVVNLRTIKPLDRETIAASVRKTHRVVAVEEGWPQCGVTSEIVTLVNEECFDDLDAPPKRVTGAEIPTPYAEQLEKLSFPQVTNIVNVTKELFA